MSNADTRPLDPAIGLLEFGSIAIGIAAGDAMVKSSPVGSIYAGTVHPGKYLVLVAGDTASVEEAMDTGRREGATSLLDAIFLPDVHPAVVEAICGGSDAALFTGEALGIIETTTVAVLIEAADTGVKAAAVDLIAVRLADGLGGKGYALFAGPIAEVEAAIESSVAGAQPAIAVIESRIIAQLHPEMADNLRADLRFMVRLSAASGRED